MQVNTIGSTPPHTSGTTQVWLATLVSAEESSNQVEACSLTRNTNKPSLDAIAGGIIH